MTVQELINQLMILNPELEVAIWNGYDGTAQQVGYVYKDSKEPLCPDEVVYIEGGQLL